MERRPEILLTGVTFLWGSTFIVTKGLLRDTPPLAYLALRFTIAAGVLFALFPRAARASRGTLTTGAVLAIGQTGGLLLQVYGQVYTTASKSAFVTALSTALTPLVGFALYRDRPRAQQLAGVLLASVGLGALTWPGSGAAWNRGDLLSLGCALVYAWVIVETARRTRQQSASGAAIIATLQTGFGAAALAALLVAAHLSLAWWPRGPAPALLAIETRPLPIDARHAAALLYMAIVCTVVTFLAQTRSMSRMSATQAAVVFALEPVFATGLAIAVEGSAEWPGPRGAAGAALILCGLLLAEVRRNDTQSE